MPEKVCLQPCLGLRKESVLLRQALYVVHEELRPDTTVLGCGPALNARVQEDIDFITNYPVLALEACELDCATRLVAKMGQRSRKTLRALDLARELALDLADLPEGHLDCEHPAVQALARRIAQEVDGLLGAD
jgi:uncharacterized metal-binding protein